MTHRRVAGSDRTVKNVEVASYYLQNSSLSMEEPMGVVTCYLLRGVILLDLSAT